MAAALPIIGIGAEIIGGIADIEAGREAGRIADRNAQRIREETEESLRRTELTQRQVVGETIAGAAASGVRFASPVTSDENGDEPAVMPQGNLAGAISGGLPGFPELPQPEPEQPAAETEPEGDTMQRYLATMRENFAKELDWMRRSGMSAADIERQRGRYEEIAGWGRGISGGLGGAARAYDWWRPGGRAGRGQWWNA